ncbi:MAG: response regulator, partial [Holosporales bacterium]|nr:response regulator [Holosporales bacterium]
QESNLLEPYVEFAPFGLLYINTKGKIAGLNETLRTWLNVSKESTVGKHISMISNVATGDATNIIGAQNGIYITLNAISTTSSFSKKVPVPVLLFSTKISDDYFALTLLKPSLPLAEDLLLALPVPSFVTDKAGKIKVMNPVIRDTYDIKPNEYFGNYLDDISKRQLEIMLSDDTNTTAAELKFVNSDITAMTCLNKWKHDEFIFQLIDTSEQKKLEQQFIQAQKTQAVGQLAGGIAHDFNNLLTAIIGFSDMLLQRIVPNDPSYADIMQIKQNANRASNLVKQLLAFSRRQSLQPRKINLTNVLSDLSALLRRLIGSQVSFRLIQGRDLWSVKVDAVQFEQVIINLAVNARDAMPAGGTLTIESSNYTVSARRGKNGKAAGKAALLDTDDLPVGDYVLIQVTDTGCGIPKELVKSIFEPFFSTKAVGQGTGLGLATAYGIVKQTGGSISVESEVGVGTTFRILLPRCKDHDDDEPVKERKLVQDVTGTETILLVEDDDAVRAFVVRALRDRGYQVVDAENGQTAMEYIKDGIKPDILVTDVSMPGMDGPMLGKLVSEVIPNIPVIFVSGYAEETFRRDLSENKSMHFLSKPFTLRELASKIREILG